MRLALFEGEEYDLVRAHDRSQEHTPLEFLDELDAYHFLALLGDDDKNALRIRQFVLDEGSIHDLHSVDDESLWKTLSIEVFTGRVCIVHPGERQKRREFAGGKAAPPTTAETTEEEEEEEVIAATDTEQKDEKTWVKFEIIDDDTGEPVKGVTLKVKLPDGQSKTGKSDAAGIIEFKDIPAGTCEIEKMIDSDTLEVVAVE